MAEKFKAHVTARFGARVTSIPLRLFRRADRDRSGGVTKEELKRMIRGIPDADVDEIFDEMDTNKNGTLELAEIENVLRAKIAPARINMIKSVFRAADADKDGVITAEDLKQILNVKLLMEANETKTEDELLDEFLSDFKPTAGGDGRITEEELIDYYSKQSTYYYTDDSFRLFIKSQWHSAEVDDAV